ncbi:rRNA small subunit methyltransferase H [Liberibacter crescens BT-1]|uniref:Ribosomal RNA small subunit methyltransferase H n=1 Tax=Liberibacter crescens (strain BT-1) TaxID=1215343 RepID=L0EWF9_LIBCB|nr:16S rRNA (cytosine(1402)-N(4))-methyltransferase RsmH [Liberibacter crescens]AGA64711.1 rRNA small subunit methyltransferase H [Liberibacter crescens BT-1]
MERDINSFSVGYQSPFHIPVFLPEVIKIIDPKPGKVILDATFGAGGYSRAFLDSGAEVIALDRDPLAVSCGQSLVEEAKGRFSIFNSVFSRLSEYVPAHGLDGAVFDVGVSSMQLDNADRGFSFQKDGPLDMRMSGVGVSAADVVNFSPVEDLVSILDVLGEEKQAKIIAHAIVKRRALSLFKSTKDLANLIENTVRYRTQYRIHPATRSFQALRIFVNNELLELAKALFASEHVLKPGGILLVVSFHSLEDRIVKGFFADRSGKVSVSRHMPVPPLRSATFKPFTKGALMACQKDIDLNIRARSAKLRAGIRTSAPSMSADLSFLKLPDLPNLSYLGG